MRFIAQGSGGLIQSKASWRDEAGRDAEKLLPTAVDQNGGLKEERTRTRKAAPSFRSEGLEGKKLQWGLRVDLPVRG